MYKEKPSKIVAISGAQGAGKTTLLEELRNRGYHVDDFKVSRSVQKQLGWKTLLDATSTWNNMVAFQEEVLLQKYRNDRSLISSGKETVLTERSFADIFAYAQYWAWELVNRGEQTFPKTSTWVSEYLQKCLKAQRECYDGLILLPLMDHIVFQDDPNRAARHFSETVFEEMVEFSKMGDSISCFPLYEKSIEDRAKATINFIEML